MDLSVRNEPFSAHKGPEGFLLPIPHNTLKLIVNADNVTCRLCCVGHRVEQHHCMTVNFTWMECDLTCLPRFSVKNAIWFAWLTNQGRLIIDRIRSYLTPDLRVSREAHHTLHEQSSGWWALHFQQAPVAYVKSCLRNIHKYIHYYIIGKSVTITQTLDKQKRERTSESSSVRVCVLRLCMCLCVRKRESERKRERVCVVKRSDKL